MGKNKRKQEGGAEQAGQAAPKEEHALKQEADVKKKSKKEEVPQQQQQQQTEGVKKKRKGSEIDDIFGSAPAKKGAQGTANSVAQEDEGASKIGVEKGKEASKKPKIEGSKDDLFGEDAKQARKRTEEGYAIYTEEELGMLKKGGDTPDCPFDCACCF